MALDVGTDYSTYPDFDPTTWIFGVRLVAEHVAREWTTERKALFYAPNVGDHVKALINGDLTRREFAEWQQRLERRAKLVKGCKACPTLITVVDGKLSVEAVVETDDGSADVLLTLTEAAQVIAVEIQNP